MEGSARERPGKRKLSETGAESPAAKSVKWSATGSASAHAQPHSHKREILFVTGNQGKLREVTAYLADGSHVSSRKLDLLEIQGTAEDIVRAKLAEAQHAVGRGVALLVEDTNLCLTAYGGFPGPYIKACLSLSGRAGLISMANGKDDRGATAVCLFGFIDVDGAISLFKGVCEGSIATSAAGESGFGWDPVFIPKDGGGRTFAEMTTEEKNRISHRAKALALLKPFIDKWLAKGVAVTGGADACCADDCHCRTAAEGDD